VFEPKNAERTSHSPGASLSLADHCGGSVRLAGDTRLRPRRALRNGARGLVPAHQSGAYGAIQTREAARALRKAIQALEQAFEDAHHHEMTAQLLDLTD
jgi:hypothetical protein